MNNIHHSVVIQEKSILGEGNTICPGAVIFPGVSIGNNNWIGPNCVIGSPPEILGWEHHNLTGLEDITMVVIGDNNVIRENVVIQSGSTKATRIHNSTFIMSSSYIAHDVEVGENSVLSSGTRLAGYVVVEEFATLGMGSLVHQKIRIGAGSMTGMGSIVTKNVLPYSKSFGAPSKTRGINKVGLERRGIKKNSLSKMTELILDSENIDKYLDFVRTIGLDDDLEYWLKVQEAKKLM